MNKSKMIIIGATLVITVSVGYLYQQKIGQIEHRQNEVTQRITSEQEKQSIRESSTTLTTRSDTSTTSQDNNDRIVDVPTIKAYKIVVNKKNPLGENYNPGEHPVAKEAFLKLKKDMQTLGFAIGNQYSGFRSYQAQKQLYENYVKQDGRVAADRYSARPGYSEHQTGLVFDMIDTSGNLLSEGIQDGAAEWLAKNAHRYGFVVRYLSGKEKITGYMPEPWHIRFVGNDATAIYQSGQTLEEYYGVAGGDYAD